MPTAMLFACEDGPCAVSCGPENRPNARPATSRPARHKKTLRSVLGLINADSGIDVFFIRRTEGASELLCLAEIYLLRERTVVT